MIASVSACAHLPRSRETVDVQLAGPRLTAAAGEGLCLAGDAGRWEVQRSHTANVGDDRATSIDLVHTASGRGYTVTVRPLPSWG